MPSSFPVRCRCGAFEAEVADPPRCTRAVCYCRDCQAFAHYLGPPPGMLDAFGGTDVAVVLPSRLRIVRGADQLACMSLTPQGTLRWFTACCRTPIGNTPRDVRAAHLGLIHTALETAGTDLTAAFGPVRMHVERPGARGMPPKSPAPRFLAAMLRYLARHTWARLSGAWRRNPLFDDAGRPRVEPIVLSPVELAALRELR